MDAARKSFVLSDNTFATFEKELIVIQPYIRFRKRILVLQSHPGVFASYVKTKIHISMITLFLISTICFDVMTHMSTNDKLFCLKQKRSIVM